MEKCRVNACFETNEHSVHTADDNSKLASKAFKATLVLYNFKLVLYLDTTDIKNQIKYYLTTSRGNFLDIQYSFYRYALLTDLLWLVVEGAFTKNSRKSRT